MGNLLKMPVPVWLVKKSVNENLENGIKRETIIQWIDERKNIALGDDLRFIYAPSGDYYIMESDPKYHEDVH